MFRDENLSQLIDKAAFEMFSPDIGLSAKFRCGIMHGAYVKPVPSSSSSHILLATQLI